MPPTTPIPRFLLPQGSSIWRSRLAAPQNVRHASKKASSPLLKKSTPLAPNPLVLEKPTKFNPPSHGSRPRKEAPRYPGPQLSAEEQARQATKKYPNMMPAEGTFMNWFLKSKSIHIWISMGTLISLAAIVWTTNFKRRSPFVDLLPSWSQFLSHPIISTRTFFDVLKMTQDHIGRETMEKRQQKVEDVAKRAAYRKAHGMDTDESFGGWTAKSDEQLLGPGIPVGDIAVAAEGQPALEPQQESPVHREKRPIKKWLGIW